jgi:heat shock protein HslJ
MTAPRRAVAGLALMAAAGGASAAEYRILAVDGMEAPSEARMAFGADGRISAHLGCNRIGASGRIEDGVLVIDAPAVMTRMACPPELAGLDDALAALLQGRVELLADPFAGTLTLRGGGFEAVLLHAP